MLDPLATQAPQSAPLNWNTYFDISSVNAVESLFSRDKEKDKWGPEVLGAFANILIYADRASFPLPVLSKDIEDFSSNTTLFEHPFLNSIKTLGSDFLRVVPFNSEKVDDIDVTKIPNAFLNYRRWARRREIIPLIKSFASYHNTPAMRDRHKRTVGKRQMIDIRGHLPSYQLQAVSKETDISEEDHLYCFDVVFRYAFYGSVYSENIDIIGAGAPYFHHPIRNAFRISEMKIGSKPDLSFQGKISFASTFERAARKFKLEEFFEAIKVLREQIERFGLRSGFSDDEVGVETLREIAIKASLPGRFYTPNALATDVLKVTLSGFVGGMLGHQVGQTWEMTVLGSVLGSSIPITITKEAWAKKDPLLPRSMTDKTWFRPLIRFDLEKEAKKR